MQTDLPCRGNKKELTLKNSTINILVSGVGGQGILLVGEIAAEAFAAAGYDVKTSAAHGMAMRGGSICSHLRIGKKIHSPLIPKGEADILIAMEVLEAARCLSYLKGGGLIILLDKVILAGVKSSGVDKEIMAIRKRIDEACQEVLKISYEEVAKQIPDIRTANIFMLGILSGCFSVKKESWLRAIKEKIPAKVKNINILAFNLGRETFAKGVCRKFGI